MGLDINFELEEMGLSVGQEKGSLTGKGLEMGTRLQVYWHQLPPENKSEHTKTHLLTVLSSNPP